METPPTGISAASYEVPFRTSATSAVDRKLSSQQDFLAGFKGLDAVPDEIRELLPESCKAAFDTAVGSEKSWFAKWGDEKEVMCRRDPVIDKAIVPFNIMLM